MSPKHPNPPFGLPVNTRTAVEHIHERQDATDLRLNDVEVEVKERLARVETKIDHIEEKLDALFDMAVEDRRERTTAIQETGKTERVRVNSRAKVIIALLTCIGTVAGAAIGLAMSGCL